MALAHPARVRQPVLGVANTGSASGTGNIP